MKALIIAAALWPLTACHPPPELGSDEPSNYGYDYLDAAQPSYVSQAPGYAGGLHAPPQLYPYPSSR